jgi:SH3-like domain-containing protein
MTGAQAQSAGRIAAFFLTAALSVQPASAQEAADEDATGDLPLAAPDAAPDPGKGPVTNLPVPRYVSLKTSDGNVRRGPSLEHRIDWVFRHPGMPLRITAEFEHWRRVEDNEGQGGWIYYTLLSGVRTILVTEAKTELHQGPGSRTAIVAIAAEGVIGKLGACTADWCEISAGGEEGWVEKLRIWGVDPAEIRD